MQKLLWIVTMLLATAPAARADERAAIEACVQHYFNASDNNAPDELAKGFHASTMMFWAGDELRLMGLSQPQWRARLANATEKRTPTARRITAVEQHGDAALVRIRSDFATFAFDDSMLLLKLDRGWTMVGKVFFRGPPQTPAPAPDEDRRAIERVIATKLESMDKNDGAQLATAYHPRGATFTVDHGELATFSIAEWAARFDENRRTNQPIPPAKRTLRKVEIAGTIASAVFDHDLGNRRVVDLANLVKTSEGWKIVQLVYVTAP